MTKPRSRTSAGATEARTDDKLGLPELPQLHKDLEDGATQARKFVLWGSLAQLALMVAAALLGTFHVPESVSPKFDPTGIGVLLFFVAILLLHRYLNPGQKEHAWYAGRAAAAQVASLSWKFAMGAHPYSRDMQPSEARRAFLKSCREIAGSVMKDEPVRFGHGRKDASQITDWMETTREADFARRKQIYSLWRLEDRATVFRGKAAWHQRRSALLHGGGFVMELIGAAMAFAKIFRKDAWDYSGVVAAALAALVAWGQMRQHAKEEKAYGIANLTAKNELAIIADVRGESEWSEYVNQVESAFDQEHFLWVARREAADPAALMSSRGSSVDTEPRTAHFIAPARSYSEYFSRLHLKMEVLLDGAGWKWQLHVPPDDDADAGNMYSSLWKVLATAGSEDAVIVVPKSLAIAGRCERLQSELQSSSVSRLVLLDQQPPVELAADERVVAVGPNNRRVGLLAALALYEKLGSEQGALYFLIDGPGGSARASGFADGVQLLTGSAPVIVHIQDKDRDETVRRLPQAIKRQWVERASAIGIFSGNDETAVAIDMILSNGAPNPRHAWIASCDALREVRFRIQNEAHCRILCSIDTKVESQAQAVVEALAGREPALIEPELFHQSSGVAIQQASAAFLRLWEEA